MKRYLKITLITGAFALSAAPAIAAGGQPETVPPENRGTANKPATPGAGAPLPEKARAYGRYCKAESRKRVEGMKGTPFSQCVTAMAKLANDRVENPRQACRAESKRRVAGMKRTPFATCVIAGAQLKRELNT